MGNNLEELLNLFVNGLSVVFGLFFIFGAPKRIRAVIVPGKSWATENTVRWTISVGIALVVIGTLLVMDQLFFYLGRR